MSASTAELLLPLGDSATGNELGVRRWHHLLAVAGLEPATAERLGRAFPSLAAVYAAGEDELVRVVGPVAASRMRWFLDAPLDTGMAVDVVASARAA